MRAGLLYGSGAMVRKLIENHTTPIMNMTTAEATIASLIAHRIRTIYALPGVHNDHLLDALFKA